MKRSLVAFLIFSLLVPVHADFVLAAGGTETASPQSQSVAGIQSQLNNDLVGSSTTPPPTPSQGGGYQSVPASSAPNGCSAQSIYNAMAGAQSDYMNKASRAVSKHQGVMQTIENQLDACSKNFLKFAFGLSSSLPGWSGVLDQIVTMACSTVGQAMYDVLMCLINGALYGTLTGQPFGFCGGYVLNTSLSGGMTVNPQTGQLQMTGMASNGNSSFSGGVSGNATPNISTAQTPTQSNSSYNAGSTYSPGQGFSGTSAGGVSGNGAAVGPNEGVTGTIQKLFQ